MKLLTINVHSWQEDNQLKKIKQLAAFIHMNNYDVVALQEVSQHKDAKIVYKNIRADNYGLLLKNELALLGRGDYELFWDLSHVGYEVYEEGLGLLTRHPNVSYESFYITNTTSIDNYKSRKIIGGTWQINDQPLSLYSCHLGWWDDEDEDYRTKVDRLMEKAHASGHPFLLLGDFNVADNITGEGYDYLLNKGLYDTHMLADVKIGESTIIGDIDGWANNEAHLKVDYIFSSWDANIKESRIVLSGVDGPVVSDHFGVEITLNNLKAKE